LTDTGRDVKNTHRKFLVFITLVGVLTGTSALLLALAPAPLTPDTSASLYAIDAPDSMEVIFQTHTPCQNGHWKAIYIHHSRTASGSALTLRQVKGMPADHFVIGNGDGAVDGEIQIGERWDKQLAAAAPAGATRIDDDCISICLVGDFDKSRPTPTQLKRVTQLVTALQARFRIAPSDVSLINQPNSAAAAGRYFPAAAFREQLLP
jgi:hypothetical protein